eukprot:tig00001304_g8108.t1
MQGVEYINSLEAQAGEVIRTSNGFEVRRVDANSAAFAPLAAAVNDVCMFTYTPQVLSALFVLNERRACAQIPQGVSIKEAGETCLARMRQREQLGLQLPQDDDERSQYLRGKLEAMNEFVQDLVENQVVDKNKEIRPEQALGPVLVLPTPESRFAKFARPLERQGGRWPSGEREREQERELPTDREIFGEPAVSEGDMFGGLFGGGGLDFGSGFMSWDAGPYGYGSTTTIIGAIPYGEERASPQPGRGAARPGWQGAPQAWRGPQQAYQGRPQWAGRAQPEERTYHYPIHVSERAGQTQRETFATGQPAVSGAFPAGQPAVSGAQPQPFVDAQQQPWRGGAAQQQYAGVPVGGQQPFQGQQPFTGGQQPFRGGQQQFTGGQQQFTGGQQPFTGGQQWGPSPAVGPRTEYLHRAFPGGYTGAPGGVPGTQTYAGPQQGGWGGQAGQGLRRF